jgi:hypothetical protein
MNKAFIAVGTLVFSAFCCCAPFSPFASSLTLKKPETSDVVGLYRMDWQNLNESESFQNRQPEILINEDGSCQVTDFPVWETDDEISYSVKESLSFKGTWEIRKFGSVRKDGKTYDSWGVSCGNNIEKMGVGGHLANDEPPYDILFIYGDPDSGNGMTFEKIP